MTQEDGIIKLPLVLEDALMLLASAMLGSTSELHAHYLTGL